MKADRWIGDIGPRLSPGTPTLPARCGGTLSALSTLWVRSAWHKPPRITHVDDPCFDGAPHKGAPLLTILGEAMPFVCRRPNKKICFMQENCNTRTHTRAPPAPISGCRASTSYGRTGAGEPSPTKSTADADWPRSCNAKRGGMPTIIGVKRRPIRVLSSGARIATMLNSAPAILSRSMRCQLSRRAATAGVVG